MGGDLLCVLRVLHRLARVRVTVTVRVRVAVRVRLRIRIRVHARVRIRVGVGVGVGVRSGSGSGSGRVLRVLPRLAACVHRVEAHVAVLLVEVGAWSGWSG